MAPSLSDSSDDEVSYTTTNVMLGYASKEPTGDIFSQLGGLPVCYEMITVALECCLLKDLTSCPDMAHSHRCAFCSLSQMQDMQRDDEPDFAAEWGPTGAIRRTREKTLYLRLQEQALSEEEWYCAGLEGDEGGQEEPFQRDLECGRWEAKN